jgi:branched-chain amino acid transport system permease protein
VIGDYKLLVYGGLLFVMMRFSPGGMAGLAARFFPTTPLGKGGKP